MGASSSREVADGVNEFTERCSWDRADDVNKGAVNPVWRCPVQRQHGRVNGAEDAGDVWEMGRPLQLERHATQVTKGGQAQVR